MLAGKKANKVLEIGSGATCYSHLLDGLPNTSEHHTLDANKKFNPTFVTDAHTMAGIPKNYYDLVLAIEMLEHCQDPKKVLANVARVLNKNGRTVASLLSFYPDHSEEKCKDYHRFMKDSVTELFEGFKVVQAIPFGNTFSTMVTTASNENRFFRLLFPLAYHLRFGNKGYSGIVVEAKKC